MKQNYRIKLLFGLVIIAITSGFTWYNSQSSLTSQAFINAPVVAVRAPIPGRTLLSPGLVVGQQIDKGQELAIIEADTENPRVSVLRTQISALENSRGTLKSEQQKIAIEIKHRTDEHELLSKQVDEQFKADIEGGESNVSISSSDLKAARLYEKEAKRNLQQASELVDGKYISQVDYKNLNDEYERAKARRISAKERLKRAKVALAALRQGVQLDGARTLPYVVTRSRNLDEQISDLKARAKHVKEQIHLIEVQIQTLKQELQQQTVAKLASPVSGAIWDIISNHGDAVAQQSQVLKVVNCEQSWVEAFLDEDLVTDLRVGDRVTVREYFGDQQWQGGVLSIRYGTGRVTVGQYMVDPPPEVMRRQLPVRVATVKIGVEWAGKTQTNCKVGSSVKVFRS